MRYGIVRVLEALLEIGMTKYGGKIRIEVNGFYDCGRIKINRRSRNCYLSATELAERSSSSKTQVGVIR